MVKKYNITVVGIGYVGLSIATLLAQRHRVYAVDILPGKVQRVNDRRSPIADELIEEYFAARQLDLTATMDGAAAYRESDFVVVATPTNYDARNDCFDTRPVESVIDQVVAVNPGAVIVVKSTVPMGFTAGIRAKYPGVKLLFSPEFLRETKALYDNLYPSRIIVGAALQDEVLMASAQVFAGVLQEGALKADVPVLFMDYTEAETVKLFANAYLALRISFFNELDTYAETKGLSTERIIQGVCLDPRIGAHYNNPSFGYGGYCLPKDTMQLLANYSNIPESLIAAIVDSNRTRMEYIASRVIELMKDKPRGKIGIYRLIMKYNSDNLRQSSIQTVMRHLLDRGQSLVIYEPVLSQKEPFMGCQVTHDLAVFKNQCGVILANRYDPCLDDVKDKVYTRDLFGRD